MAKMTKAQREKAERLMLKATLENNPKLKETIDALIDNKNPETIDVVAPVIEEELKKARMQGVMIGWSSFALRAVENVKGMKSVEEVVEYFQGEADKMQKKLNLPKVEE